jgi:formylglycine-generating enzyme required for sulfatase activity
LSPTLAHAADAPTVIKGVDDAEMVLVPAGAFRMGSDPAEVERVRQECRRLPGMNEACNRYFEREGPEHEVELDAFYIDCYEVTNNRFEKFVRAANYQTTAEKERSGLVFATGPFGIPSGPWR